MSDPTDPNQPPPELELARPVRSSPSQPPTGASNPSLQAVRTASREIPIPEEQKKGLTKERVKEGAIDTVLNSVSILGEMVEDFRTSDRFFKYKAGVLGVWFVFVVSALGVACPTSGPRNDIDAHLVVSGEAGAPLYMVQNESREPWKNVEILVNGAYRSTASELGAEGGSVTLTPAVLFDEAGKRAPGNLVITEIVVKVGDPEAEVVLLKGGQPRH